MIVHPCGTKVILNGSKYEGYITQIMIRDNNIRYEITYWENGEHKESSFSPYEFTTELHSSLVIGFTTGENQ